LVTLVTLLALLALPHAALAAPEAHILRVDPRAMQDSGDPIINTVVEVVQSKRVSEATAQCAALTGDGQLDCMSQALEKAYSLYQPFPFPEANAIFTVLVDGMDRPGKLVSTAKWGSSSQLPGVGTAWLIVIDADSRMGSSFEDAKQVAQRFVASMGPNDIVNIMFFNDRQVVLDSKWLAASAKSKAAAFISSGVSYPKQGRNRSLLTLIKSAATDGFKALGNAGSSVKVPMHQAMVVLSSGFGGADPATTGPGALQLQQYLSGGRFPEDNTALPKTPVPVISVYFPQKVIDEFRMNAFEFMQNLANPEIGGFFTIVRAGGGSRADDIVKAVRTRFSKMHLVRWRVSCVAPTVTQSFKLVFNNVDPPIAGDSTFKDVPVGINPSTWPLDVNIQYTKDSINEGVYPGGQFKVFGDFCWGGEKDRAEVYFLPAGQQVPTELNSADVEKAKQTQQQLISMGMKGSTLVSSDTFVELQAPDKDKIVHGTGAQAVVRVVLYDNKAHRMSGVTADTILELKATNAPFPLMLVLGGALGLTVIALLLVVVLRGGGKKRPQITPPMPVVASGMLPSTLVSARANRATIQGPAGSYSLSNGSELRLGRDPSQCSILINDPAVSSFHATLKLEHGVFTVRDEGSNNGTFVNDGRIAKGVSTSVASGSRLRFGPVEFSVRLD
jgi:hypothetical protein